VLLRYRSRRAVDCREAANATDNRQRNWSDSNSTAGEVRTRLDTGNGDGTGMNVLIINCGSSSQAFSVYRTAAGREPVVLISGKARNVATTTQEAPYVQWTCAGQTETRECDLSTHGQAARAILAIVQERSVTIGAIGHRFVHGGSEFTHTARIDDSVLSALQRTIPLAPIHNPIRSAS